MLPGLFGSTTIDCCACVQKANTHGDGRRNRDVVAIEPVSTMAADISNDRALGGNLRLPHRRSFRPKARPPRVRSSASTAQVARRDRFTRGLPAPRSMPSWAHKRKRPDTPGAPKLHPVRPSGGELGRLDLQDLAGTRVRDRPRLHRLWNLAHEVDVQEPVL